MELPVVSNVSGILKSVTYTRIIMQLSVMAILLIETTVCLFCALNVSVCV